MNNANSKQVAGNHYKSSYQHWDWVAKLNLCYLSAQVSRYISRWRKKNGIEDLKKAQHFLQKLSEVSMQKFRSAVVDTELYITANPGIETKEREVLMSLVYYTYASFNHLADAEVALRTLIEEEERKLGV